MANVTRKQIKQMRQFGGVPYGNLTVLHFNLTLNSSGVWVDSDQSTAIAASDVLRLGILPAGFQPIESMINVSDVGQASTTFDLGYLYTDGVDVSGAAQDQDGLYDGGALDSQAVLRGPKAGVSPPILAKDAYLTFTNLTDAQDEAMVVDVYVYGILHGPK